MTEDDMIKKSLFQAVCLSAGITAGGVLIPRLLHPQRYNATYPPLWAHALGYFLVGISACFAVYLLINLFMYRKKNTDKSGNKK